MGRLAKHSRQAFSGVQCNSDIILGRKCRFNTWEPAAFGMNKALPY